MIHRFACRKGGKISLSWPTLFVGIFDGHAECLKKRTIGNCMDDGPARNLNHGWSDRDAMHLKQRTIKNCIGNDHTKEDNPITYFLPIIPM